MSNTNHSSRLFKSNNSILFRNYTQSKANYTRFFSYCCGVFLCCSCSCSCPATPLPLECPKFKSELFIRNSRSHTRTVNMYIIMWFSVADTRQHTPVFNLAPSPPPPPPPPSSPPLPRQRTSARSACVSVSVLEVNTPTRSWTTSQTDTNTIYTIPQPYRTAPERQIGA